MDKFDEKLFEMTENEGVDVQAAEQLKMDELSDEAVEWAIEESKGLEINWYSEGTEDGEEHFGHVDLPVRVFSSAQAAVDFFEFTTLPRNNVLESAAQGRLADYPGYSCRYRVDVCLDEKKDILNILASSSYSILFCQRTQVRGRAFGRDYQHQNGSRALRWSHR